MRGKNMSLNWTENKRRIQRGMLAFLVLLACFLCVKPTQAAGTRIRGIDVSRYQGTINWKKVKNAGIDFTMIGVGYVIDGVRQGDPKFEYNIKNAIQAGVDFRRPSRRPMIRPRAEMAAPMKNSSQWGILILSNAIILATRNVAKSASI